MSRTILFILVLCLICGALGYNYFYLPFKDLTFGQQLVVAPTPAPTPEPLSPEEVVIAGLTPHDKITQLLAVPLSLNPDESIKNASGETATASSSVTTQLSWIRDQRPGFVTLFGRDLSAAEIRQATAQIKGDSTATLSALVALDHEGGSVQRLSATDFVTLPDWNSLCSQPVAESTDLLTQSAQQLKTIGIDLIFGPTVDVGTTKSPLRTRVCSDDPQVVSNHAAEWIQAFQKQRVTPVLKHFPGIGSTTKDLHLEFDRVSITERDTQPYFQLLDRFPTVGVMTSHVGIANQNPEVPCSQSTDCIGQLKGAYPQVLIFSDALEMASAQHQATSAEPKPIRDVAADAILAGNDVLVWGDGVEPESLDTLIQDLEAMYSQSPTFKARVDASLMKVIHFKMVRQ